MRWRAWAVVAIYAVIALGVYPVFPHFQSPNELTRWAFAASLVEHGTAEVSPVLPLLSPGFEDLSVVEGRTYSNKAPGAALVGLPGYWLASVFAGPASAESMRAGVTLMRVFAATFPVLLMAGVFVWAAVSLGGERSRLPVVLAILLFATPLFTYGLLLFSHALVAACLFAAWAAIFVPGRPRTKVWREVAGGALIGLAAISEYPAAFPGVALVACAALRRDPARLLRVLAGAVPFGLGLAIYNTLCFGGPFELSSGHEKAADFSDLARSGLFGIGPPRWDAFAGLLGSPSKGLLIFSPILILSLWALRSAVRFLPRDGAIAIALAPITLFTLYSGYPNWHGGWTTGARYLVPALPFLVFPFVFRGGGRLEAALAGASVAAVALPSLTFPLVPPDFPLPWGTFALPLLLQGLAAPNAMHLAWHGAAVLLPFALVALAVGIALPPARLPFAAAGVVGALLVGSAALGTTRRQLMLGVQRSYVEDVYFQREGALELGLRGVAAGARPLYARRDLERSLGPSGWPFRP